MPAKYTLTHFELLNEATQERLHNLGLYEGKDVALIQRGHGRKKAWPN